MGGREGEGGGEAHQQARGLASSCWQPSFPRRTFWRHRLNPRRRCFPRLRMGAPSGRRWRPNTWNVHMIHSTPGSPTGGDRMGPPHPTPLPQIRGAGTHDPSFVTGLSPPIGASPPLRFSSLGLANHGTPELETGTTKIVQTQAFEWCRWEGQGVTLATVRVGNFFMHDA